MSASAPPRFSPAKLATYTELLAASASTSTVDAFRGSPGGVGEEGLDEVLGEGGYQSPVELDHIYSELVGQSADGRSDLRLDPRHLGIYGIGGLFAARNVYLPGAIRAVLGNSSDSLGDIRSSRARSAYGPRDSEGFPQSGVVASEILTRLVMPT